MEKEVRRIAKNRKGSDRKSDRTRQKNKKGDIEKWDQTDSPDIPDWGGGGGTIRNPQAFLRGSSVAPLPSKRTNELHANDQYANERERAVSSCPVKQRDGRRSFNFGEKKRV